MTSRILTRTTLLEASRFRVDKVSYLMADGETSSREVLFYCLYCPTVESA
jgi:hypothetical protein